MNLKRAVKISLAKIGENQSWLAGRLGVSRQRMSDILRADSVQSRTTDSIAFIFGINPSELIALGEDDEVERANDA